jgi:uncharacterized protein
MRIAVLSDTHNNVRNLQAALEMLQQQGIDTILHCGDMTSVETAQKLVGFRVIFVYGNGDIASGAIRETLLRMNPASYAGMVYKGKIGDARIAATHGHLPGVAEELIRSGEFDYVFTGHSHKHIDERHGRTRLINPGALGGMRREERQCCLLDLDAGKASFIEIRLD